MGIGQPGSTVQGGGASGFNGNVQSLTFRDPVDAARSMMGQRAPSAEYPDGYLGTIQSRREDRVLNTVKERLNERGYQRGVHKGERIDPSDYYWPSGYGPDSGTQRQSRAIQPDPLRDRRFLVPRQVPAGTFRERLTTMGEKMPREVLEAALDPRAASDLNRLRPPWAT